MEKREKRGTENPGGRPVDLRLRPSPTYCSFLRSRARTRINQTSSSRVLRIRAARSWVKSLCVRRLDLLFAQPPPPAKPKRGSVPIGARGGRFPPTSLARQVGGASRLCEPDPASARAKLSLFAPAWRRRRKLRR